MKDKKLLKEISDDALRKVDLEGKQKHYPHELSGGMKQRVAIIRSLLNHSPILLI